MQRWQVLRGTEEDNEWNYDEETDVGVLDLSTVLLKSIRAVKHSTFRRFVVRISAVTSLVERVEFVSQYFDGPKWLLAFAVTKFNFV